jgi:hypothetical protein
MNDNNTERIAINNLNPLIAQMTQFRILNIDFM